MNSTDQGVVTELRNSAASAMPEVKLDEQQIRYAMTCVMQWIEIYQANMDKPSDRMLAPNTARPTPPDAIHSALLYRLLQGKKPFRNPPPKRFSYPSYEMAEGLPCQVMEIWEHTQGNIRPDLWAEFLERSNGYTIVVDQHIGWKWINKYGQENDKGVPETGILEYKDGTQYRFWWGMKTFKRLDKTDPKGYVEFQERVKYMQLITEKNNAGTHRNLHTFRQPDQQ